MKNYSHDSIPFTRSIDYQLLTQLCSKSAGESSLQFNVFLTFRSSLPKFANTQNLGIEPDKTILDCFFSATSASATQRHVV
jgi:hypothetical protein